MATLVSIVLLNLNGEKLTIDCLKSLEGIDYPLFEVIVVDNGSKAESIEAVKAQVKASPLDIRLIVAGENLGFAEGNNLGVRNAKGSYVVLLNNDTIVHKSWLSEMVKVLEAGPKIAIVGSKVHNTSGFYQGDSAGNLLWILGEPLEHAFKDPSRTFMVMGCSLLFRKDIVGEPFDKGYFMYSEDTALAWRMKLLGYEARIAMSSTLDHLGGVVRKVLLERLEFNGEKNKVKNLLLFYETKTLIKLAPAILLNSFLSVAIAAFRGRFRVRLGSYMWIARNFPTIMKERGAIQSSRKVGDREILKLMTHKSPFAIRYLQAPYSTFLYLYCWLLRIHTYEFYKDAV